MAKQNGDQGMIFKHGPTTISISATEEGKPMSCTGSVHPSEEVVPTELFTYAI